MNRSFANLLFLALLMASINGHSFEKRGSTVGELLKKIESQGNLKKDKRNLPKFNKVESKSQPKPVNLGAVKPPPTSKLYYDEGSDEAQLEQVTDSGIKQLFGLTQRFKNSSKRGELWLRLAEAYVDKSRLMEYRAYNEFDKKMEDYQKGKTKRRPKINLSSAKSYNKKAIQLYEWFLRDFSKDEKVPQALFFLGYNYFELGDVKKGQEYYKLLTSKYPKSSYVDESNFALGEFYFENDRWKEAELHYRKVVKNKRSRIYAFAMYKLAWALFKQGQYRNALATVETVVYHGRRLKGKQDGSAKGLSSIRLANEAIKDIVVFFAEAKDYKIAYDYFGKVAGTKTAMPLYEKLGYYYMDRGNRKAAKYIFEDLISLGPASPKAFEYQYKVVSMYSTAGNNSIFRDELFKWIEQFGPGSAWQKANSGNKELVQKSELLAEATLRNYTLQLHQTAQNSRAKFSQTMAQKGYNLYFTTFKSSERLDEMHFFYGELLYDMKDYRMAATSYMWNVENAQNSKYFKDSLLNAIFSLEKLLPNNREIKDIVGENTQPIEFDRSIKDFEKAVTLYVTKIPDGKDRVDIKYKLGTLYYYYNQFDSALTIFDQIIKQYPKTKFAEYSANLTLDIYNLKKDYVGLEKAADEILAVPGLTKTNLGIQIRNIKQKTIFKRAESLEKSNDYVKAAKAYEEFAEKNPKSELVPSAKFNAAINFEKAADFMSALIAYKSVASVRGKANAGIARKSQKFVAEIYQRLGRYEEAAEAFEEYARDYPSDSDSIDFIYNAAIIRDGMKYYTAALKAYSQYLDKSKKKDRFEVLFYMGKVWEKRGKFTTAISYYEKYINSPSTNRAAIMETLFTIASLSEKLKWKKTEQWYRQTVSTFNNFKKAGEAVGTRYAAEAQFKLVYPTFVEFRRMKIPSNPAKQGQVVQKKLNYLERLKGELKSVIRFDDANQIVASLTVQGQALQHMAAALYNAPTPPGLNEEQLKIYKGEVEKLAKPLQDQAIESYKAAIKKGFDLGGYNDWLNVAMKELNNIDSNLYPDHGEIIFEIRKADSLGI